LAAATRLGVVLATYTVLLVAVYYGAHRARQNTTLVCFLLAASLTCLAFAAWKRLDIPMPAAAGEILRAIYDVSTAPAKLAAFFLDRRFSEFIYFVRSHEARPFVVFVFWLGVALTVLAAAVRNILAAACQRRCARRLRTNRATHVA
jgi:hypothetical protein